MRVTVRVVVIGMCLTCVALLGACGAKQAGTATPAPSPLKTLTAKQRANAYFKALLPVSTADDALSAKLAKQMAQLKNSNGFSCAAWLENTYRPAMQQIKARLVAIKPPSGFTVAHARLVQAFTLESDSSAFLRDAIRRAVYTHTVDTGFLAEVDRYTARIKKLLRQYDVALKAAAKRAGVKVPPKLLSGVPS
jgi:hypothetical protein